MVNGIKVIVNADDFGISEVTSHVIMDFMDKGYCDTTTVMINMNDYRETFEFAKSRNALEKIGLHINLTEGPAITSGMRSCSTFCNEKGFFDFRYRKNIKKRFFLNKNEKKLVENEIRAQMERYISLGYKGFFADSHQGIHMDWSIYPIVLKLCQEYGYKRIRRSPNLKPKTKKNVLKSFIHVAYDNAVKRSGIFTPDYLGNIDDYKRNKNIVSDNALVEIMSHPSQKSNTIYIDVFSDMKLETYQDELEKLNHLDIKN